MKSRINILMVAGCWPFLFNVTGSYRNSQLLFVFSMIILSIIASKSFFVPKMLFSILLSFFTIVFITSVFSSTDITRTLSDSLRILFFGFFLVVGYNYNVTEKKVFETLKNVMKFSFVISFFVYFERLYPFLDFFKGRLSNDELFFHFVRHSGTFGFPTDYSSFLVFCIMIFTLDTSNKYLLKKWRIIYVSICIVGVLLSFSRGGILQLLCFVLLYVLFVAENRLTYIFTGLIILFLFYIILYTLVPDEFLKYIIVDFSNIDASVMHRFREIEISIDVLKDKIWLYNEDRVKPYGLSVVEGFWTHWIIRYSYIGILFWSALYIYFIGNLRQSRNLLPRVIVLWLLTFVIVGLFSDVMFRFKGIFIYPFLIGVGIKLSDKSFEE